MKHFASSAFWARYQKLPVAVQKLADKNFELLKENALHPSLHFKKAGNYRSIRIGLHNRALAIEVSEGLLWFWIGSHSNYDQLIM